MNDLPDQYKTLEMCEKAVEKDLYQLYYVPDDAVCRDLYYFLFIPDGFKTQEMCEKAVEDNPWGLEYVPEHLKTKQLCKKAVEDGPWSTRCPRTS